MARPPTPGLRDRLLQEALSLVDERGVQGLSLRELAAKVGVSRQAPYLHHRDRVALLAAVGAECFRTLTAAVEVAVAGAGDGPEAPVRALARAYGAYVAAYPHRRELMNGPHVAKSDSPELQAEAARLFALGRELVARCPRPCTDVLEARRRILVLWGAAHGIVALGADRQIPVSVGAGVGALIDEAVDTLLRGWAADPREERR